MPIHHATVKRAASLGVILTATDDSVEAHMPDPYNIRVALDAEDDEANLTDLAKDALVAVIDMKDYMAEHLAIRLTFEDGDFVAYNRVMQEQTNGAGGEIARDPDLADLFETLAEQPEDEADDEDDEDEPSGSVVPEKYKKLYAERGDATNCGDWLALKLNSLCKVMDGKKETTDLDRLETIAASNGVEPSRYGKLGVATNGWQGRYRMTVRNMLTKVVAAKGFLFIPEGCGVGADTEAQAPAEWCASHSPKPKAAADGSKVASKTDKAAQTQSARPVKAPRKPKAGKKAEADAQAELGLKVAREAIQGAQA